MKIRYTRVREGSLQLRLIRKDHDHHKYPPYFAHTLLEPLGNHGAELKGLSETDSIRQFLTLALEIARSEGYWYVVINRVKNDELKNTVYWLQRPAKRPAKLP